MKKPLNDGLAQSRASLVNVDFFNTKKYYEQKSLPYYVGAHPQIFEFKNKLIAKFKAMGIPMFVHCCMRSHEQQTALYRKGHTKAKAGQSPHQYGLAVDIIHSIYGWNLPTEKGWQIIGKIGKEVAIGAHLEIEWGGDWNFYDPAHWQIADWKTLKQ